MDLNELILEHGVDYLYEVNPDAVPIPMDELDTFDYPANDLLNKAYFGETYSRVKRDEKQQFNPNYDYFAFDGYANFIAIHRADIECYLSDHIDEEYFIEWCKENEYIVD